MAEIRQKNQWLAHRWERCQTNGPSMPPPGSMMTGAGGAIQGEGEISLRPARNFTVLKPNTPSMLPKSAQISGHSHTPPVS